MRIFFSYQEADNQTAVQELFAFLARHFGKDKVVGDLANGMPIGADYRQRLVDEVARAEVLLAVIGPNWLRTIQENASDPNDFVRVAIETALDRKMIVVPVLMGGRIPTEDELPQSIAKLSFMQAFTVDTGADFCHPAKMLCGKLEASVKSWSDVAFVIFTAFLGYFAGFFITGIGYFIGGVIGGGNGAFYGWAVCAALVGVFSDDRRFASRPFIRAWLNAMGSMALIGGFLYWPFVGLHQEPAWDLSDGLGTSSNVWRASHQEPSWYLIPCANLAPIHAIIALVGATRGWLRGKAQKAKM